MTEEQALSRPIGWWLKEADARLDRAFERAFEGTPHPEPTGVRRDRRTWQVLSALAGGPRPADDVVAALAAFASPAAVRAVLDDLTGRGEVADDGGTLRLTDAGVRTQAALAPMAGTVRRRVSAALPEQDYRTLVLLLARLVDGLAEDPADDSLDRPARRPATELPNEPPEELTER